MKLVLVRAIGYVISFYFKSCLQTVHTSSQILDVTLVFFAALVARDSKSLTELAHKTDLVEILFATLRSASLEKDWLGLLSLGISDTALKKFGVVNNTEKALVRFLILSIRYLVFIYHVSAGGPM